MNGPHSRNLLTLVVAAALFASGALQSAQAAPPEAQQLENLQAFAKLYGYVRYFHPSDEAQLVDWDLFAMHGAREVNAAGSVDELERTLRELFEPLAPTLVIYREGETVKGLQPQPEGPMVAWQHRGVGLEQAGRYESVRVNRPNRVLERGTPFGNVLRWLPADDLRGLPVRLSFFARAEEGGRGRGWLRVDRPHEQRGFFDNMEDRPVISPEWQRYVIEGEVAVDAEKVYFGFMSQGDGATALDGVQVEVRGASGWRSIELENGDFESANPRDGWGFTPRGWTLELQRDGAPSGEQFGVVRRAFSDIERLFERLPEHGEVVERSLTPQLRFRMPISLPAAAVAPTTPALEALVSSLTELNEEPWSALDLGSRVGNVVQAWNVFQHFYPYFDQVPADWNAVLPQALERTLEDSSRSAHRQTLQWMVAQLHDGHGRVGDRQWESGRASPPLSLSWVEGRIAVRSAGAGSPIEVGDLIVRIDGHDALERLEELVALRSGSLRWARRKALFDLLRGPMGETVTVDIERDGAGGTDGTDGTVEEFELTYEVPWFESPKPPAIEAFDDGVYYVDLSRASWPEISGQLEQLAEAPGVVFDLRGYPTGNNHQLVQHLTSKPVMSARWNVPLQIRPDQVDPEWDTSGRWDMPPAEPRIQGRVVFLTGGGAISYAESIMAIVAHYELAEIVGEATAGANGNVNSFRLPGDFSIHWTGMRVTQHDGSQHHLLGVQPTVAAQPTLAGLRQGRDEVLEGGLALARGESDRSLLDEVVARIRALF